ncbi:MAG: DEAD/DEAH box helicase family protein [Candidatus Cloacimonetes bacterium]|nr:DEAD/DEAH box helicase family protein [Candidatus Cloacimonadota bacterium]
MTPAIESKWDAETQIRMEKYFTDGRINVTGNTVERKKGKKADYLLSYKSNIPLAIVEAKDNNSPLGAGMQQAIDYAEILDVPFAYSSNGDAFLEHDMKNGTEREISLAEFPSPSELWNRHIGNCEFTPDQQKLITEPYYYRHGDKTPRYYQINAINRTIEAIAKGQNRILLVMATGTGKTYTAFQIVHRLHHAGVKRKILYLADRNILVDQTMNNDFKSLNKVTTKITGKLLDSAYEIYFSLYHQLTGDDQKEAFREFKPNFFDLIIVDECHRGSAREDSRWKKILNYFTDATQIGMTATPKETTDVSNISYFGEPLYTYSLKQGIEDGFLAPYKVIRVSIDKDVDGWRPPMGKVDVYGNEIEDREYTAADYDKTLIIDDRTKAVAKRVSDHLKATNRFDKTIVFCVDQEHAERMRQALVNENNDLVAENPKYIMRITGDDKIGKGQLDNFIDIKQKYPVIVTTSKLLTTGVDCVACRLIVIDSNIQSLGEFKQVIGRGTRLSPDIRKYYFTIIDFRKASRLFADPGFDGEPFSIIRDGQEDDPDENINDPINPYPPDIDDLPKIPKDKYRVNDVPVSIILETEQYIDKDGKLTTGSIKDFTRKNILGQYATLEDFLQKWNSDFKKYAIISELVELGVSLEELRKVTGLTDIDDFDLICHIAYDQKPLTKFERVNKVKKTDYLSKYQGIAREVLSALLDKYSRDGIKDIADIQILQIDPFRSIASYKKVLSEFGGLDAYQTAVSELQNRLYT